MRMKEQGWGRIINISSIFDADSVLYVDQGGHDRCQQTPGAGAGARTA
ncbi:MAG: hypothetical protein R2911_29470 [Caldilineaceae bacterium]